MHIRVWILIATIVFAYGVLFDASITIDHNTNESSSSTFKFARVPSPARDDPGARAKLVLIDGEADPGSGDLNALIDGRLPVDEDDPGANFFFDAGTFGGRLRMDLGTPLDIGSVNTYSWHPNTRGPQLYKLYGADGRGEKFNASPKRWIDPATVGWKYLATVSTLPASGEEGGQYGVSVAKAEGLGKFRYLLFDFYVTEMNDDFGNTFYSEIDVLEKR